MKARHILQRIMMRSRIILFLVAGIFSVPAILQAADVPFDFKTPQQEQRYNDLTKQLRCLVCQNQSLADSQADLAQDLRNEVYSMIMKGKSNKEIVDFLVARYGDFVLFKPPLEPRTVLLWIGPFLLLFAAILIVFRFTLKNSKKVPVTLTGSDQQKLDELLHKQSEGEGD